MKTLLLITFLACLTGLEAQRHKSSCDTANNTAYFRNDMDQLLLQHMKLNSQAQFDNETDIRQDSFLYYLKRLSVLRNHKSVKALDTIFGVLRLHSDEKLLMRKMEVVASESFNWVYNLKLKKDSSGHPTVDKYIRDYGMTYKYYDLKDGRGAIHFEASKNININAFKARFKAIDNTIVVNPQSQFIGERSYIEVMRTDDSTAKAIITYGFGDCQAGCIYHVRWRFTIHDDCSFHYNGISGDTAQFRKLKMSVEKPEGPEPKVYPNPFSTALYVEGIEPGSSYEMYDMNGKLLGEGIIPGSGIDAYQYLSPGIYTLKIFSEQRLYSVLLAKN